MNPWGALTAKGAVVRLVVHRFAKHASTSIVQTARTAVAWHREKLTTDPLYATALAAGGGALIQILVPSLRVANALRTVLHTMLGNSTPPLYGGRYGSLDDRWEDDE